MAWSVRCAVLCCFRCMSMASAQLARSSGIVHPLRHHTCAPHPLHSTPSCRAPCTTPLRASHVGTGRCVQRMTTAADTRSAPLPSSPTQIPQVRAARALLRPLHNRHQCPQAVTAAGAGPAVGGQLASGAAHAAPGCAPAEAAGAAGAAAAARTAGPAGCFGARPGAGCEGVCYCRAAAARCAAAAGRAAGTAAAGYRWHCKLGGGGR